MIEYIQKEVSVSLYTLYLKLVESSYSLVCSSVEISSVSCYLYKKAVVIRSDDSACKAVAAVESYAVA